MAMQTGDPNKPKSDVKPETDLGKSFREADQAQAFKATGVGSSAPFTQQKKQTAMDIDTAISRPVGRQSVGESTHALAQAIKKQMDAAIRSSQRDMFELHVMDRAGGGGHFSSILICKAVNVSGRAIVSVYNYLVEASAQRLAARQFSQINPAGQGPVVVPTVASDAIDDVLRAKTVAFLQGIYGVESQIVFAGAQVLPTELAATDTASIGMIVYISTQALTTSLVTSGYIEEEVVDVRMLAAAGQSVVALDTAPPELFDSVGFPIRSDFGILLRQQAEQNQNGANWSPNESSSTDLTVINGYLEVDYHVPAAAQAANYYQGNVPPPTQRYMPRIVITHADALTTAVTLEMLLLALATTPLIARNNAWMQLLKPSLHGGKKNKNEINLRDVTALGYETPAPGMEHPDRLPAPSGSDMGNFYRVLALLITPNPIITLHVAEAGDSTWLHRDLYAAALPGPEGVEATLRLNKTADRLSNGHMSQQWPGNEPIAIAENDRVFNGYYEGYDNRRHDCRDLGYIGVANIVGPKGDIALLHEWSATKYDVNVPLELRLQKRYQIESELLPGFVLKSYSRPIVINPNWLAALAKSLQLAGLIMQSSDALHDLAGQTIRGNYATDQYALNYNQSGINLFGSGNVGYGNYRGLGAAPMSRFGGGHR